jgi:hypothetical protein
MQIITALLALGGDPRNTVPLDHITVAEAHLLRAIHGHEAVFDVQPVEGEIDVAPRAEIARLAEQYAARDEDGNSIVARVFAGGAASVPMEIADMDLPETAFRVTQRVSAPAPKRKRAPKAEPGSAVAAIDDGSSDADEVFA